MTYYYRNRYNSDYRPKPKPLPEKTVFALKQRETDLYWNGTGVPMTPSGVNGKTPKLISWKPKFATNPQCWTSRDHATKACRAYYRFRQFQPDLPELELTSIKTGFTVEATEDLNLCPKIIEEDRIRAQFGLTLAAAYDKLKIAPEEADSFVYVVKRRGKSKAMIDESDIQGSASYGCFTFLARENDALHVKLMLGEHFDKLWKIR